MSKNIVVFSDGTGQDGGNGHDTNVYRLFNMIVDRHPDQIAFYDRGLGTGWRKLTGSVAGMGISQNIMECYRFIFENYAAGDRIFLFGFSRGATTVRSLSAFIHHFGILPKSREELIKKAYKIYKIRDPEKREQAAEAFVKQHHTMWCEIEFLGVWDTVAALGLPIKSLDVVIDKLPSFKHKYHDFSLSPSVKNAYHALAIDEERKTFQPVLWDPEIRKNQTMRQVWFCGMHSDVGGGYREHELSDIPLGWMVQNARDKGLLIHSNHSVTVDPNSDGKMHDSRGGTLSRFYRPEVRSWDAETRGKPHIHQSVLERSCDRYNREGQPYRPWILDHEYQVEEWHPDLLPRMIAGSEI